MSGPKGYRYTVISEEEKRRREDEARTARCRQHLVTLAGLLGQLRHHGMATPAAPEEPSRRTHDALIAWERDLTDALARAEVLVSRAAAAAIARQLDVTNDVDTTAVSLSADSRPANTSARSATSRTAGAGHPLASQVRKVLDSVALLQDPDARAALTALAATIVRIHSLPQAEGDLLTLKTRVSSALTTQRLRRAAEATLLEIAGLTSADADRLRARAGRISTSEELRLLRSEVAQLGDAAARSADAAFVERALADVLTELGYQVDEGFQLIQYGTAAVVGHPQHPHYGMRFQVNPVSEMLLTRLIAHQPTTPDADARAEALTCATFHQVASELYRHGVRTALSIEQDAGASRVDQPAVGSRQSARSTRKRERTR